MSSSRKNDGKNSNAGRRRSGGWRFLSPKVVAACQYDASAAVAGTPNQSTGALVATIANVTTETAYETMQNEHEARIRERISNISNDMIVRFLRRSLFQAFSNEDLIAAHSCYVATRDDFEQHFITLMQEKFLQCRLQHEEEEERQTQEEEQSRKRYNKRSSLKRKGVVVESPCSVIHPLQIGNTNRTADTSGIAIDLEADHEIITPVNETYRPPGLLQQTMDICKPFILDDYLDPYRDPYHPVRGDDGTTDDGNIDNGTINMVDAINELVNEILLISSMKYGACKQNLTAFLSTSSSLSTTTRNSFRRNRPQTNEVDINSGSDDAIADSMTWSMQRQNAILLDPLIVTTPLHEVARLGHVELLKCMLQQSSQHKNVDLDARNGYGRTVLHNVAGGLISSGTGECDHARISTSVDVDTGNIVRNVGIGAPQNPAMKKGQEDIIDNQTTCGNSVNESSISQRLSRMVNRSGRWLSTRNTKAKMNDETEEPRNNNNNTLPQFGKFSVHGCRQNLPIARIDRMATTHIILSWRSKMTAMTRLCDSDAEVRTEDEIVATDDQVPFEVSVVGKDGYSDGGHVSTNAVDVIMNRTALHYAAELGRVDICDAILSSFYGTMLTILDNAGRTPCELAALYNHKELAAYLEARSLLYVDPYGTEEELLSTISMAEMNHNDVAYYRYNLVAPFCCFETISRSNAEHQREKLIQEAVEQINQHVAEFYQRKYVKGNVDPPGATSISTSDDSVLDDEQTAAENDQIVTTLSEERDFFNAKYDVDDPPGIIKNNHPIVPDEIYGSAMEVGIHEGHVEKLLSYHKWLVSDMIAALQHNPLGAFNNAGVPIPRPPHVSLNGPNSTESALQYTCLICCDEFHANTDKWKQMSGCGHGFCTDCLTDYINEYTISSSNGYVIECPHHDCAALMSASLISDVVPPSSDAYNRLRRSAIDAFVVSAQDYTYCPYPGCGDTTVIHALYPKFVNPSDVGVLRLIGGVCTNVHNVPPDGKPGQGECSNDEPMIFTYESVPDPRLYDLLDMVQPQLAHRFCFLCGEKQIHWPITCAQLQDWRSTIIVQVGEKNTSNESCSNFNDVAQNLWMKINTRPCPKCNAPIQKDEGCNHITCRNPYCKHQFCWICRADWSSHNTATGGNYRCNRWVEQKDHKAYDGETTIDAETTARVLAEVETDPSLMGETYGTARHESRISKKRSAETARFLHHYERWCGHLDSAVLEQNMRMNLCERLAPVVRKAIEYGGGIHIFGGKGVSFIHAAFSELLECRSMLQHSYAFAFVNYKPNIFTRQQSNEKVVFERIQSELELLTEQISDVVARTHIRASETQINFLTKVTSGKRKEFTNFMIDVLRHSEIDKNKQLNSNQMNLPGHRPTNVRRSDYNTDDDEDLEAAAEAIRRSLDTYDAATNRHFHYNVDDNDIELHDWACNGCTYMNAGAVRRCDMCGTRR